MAKKTKKARSAKAGRHASIRSSLNPNGGGLEGGLIPEPATLEFRAAETAGSTPTATNVATPMTTAADSRRRVTRIDNPIARPNKVDPFAFAPLEPDDAAIPFDRVPYVPADLRRVAVIAALMIVLIIVANIVVNAVAK